MSFSGNSAHILLTKVSRIKIEIALHLLAAAGWLEESYFGTSKKKKRLFSTTHNSKFNLKNQKNKQKYC